MSSQPRPAERAARTGRPAQRPARAPGFVHASVAAAMALVVTSLALNNRQPSPPAIAELAPQARAQITEAPSEQSSDFGTGADGGPGGQGATGSPPPPTAMPGQRAGTTTLPAIDVPRVRRCIGDPPRQIEDPQSPPCVPYFDGPNGGETSMGVTADEIRVAYPSGVFLASGNGQANINRVWNGLGAFFNKRFEFYGRKIRLVPYTRSNPAARASQVDPAKARADAVKVAEEIQAFASLGYDYDVAGYDYYDELARRGVISTSAAVPSVTEEHFTRFHPYQWSYVPDLSAIQRNFGQWICNQVAGRQAAHAGGEEMGKRRKFGLVVHSFPDYRTDTALLEATVEGCRASPTVKLERKFDQNDATGETRDAEAAILQMKLDGVTTVICICHVCPARGSLQRAATNQGYFPEWLFSSFLHNDFYGWSFCGTGNPPEQLRHSFGLSFRPKAVATADLPVTQAMKEVDPTFTWDSVNAGPGPDFAAQVWNWMYYKAFLVLASGIQAAGPNLTPETFAAGLQRTRFPNPDTPDFAGRVGFAGDHAMVNDAAVIWWSPTATSTWGTSQGPGSWCYADRGRRYALGSWPVEEPRVFTGGCE